MRTSTFTPLSLALSALLLAGCQREPAPAADTAATGAPAPATATVQAGGGTPGTGLPAYCVPGEGTAPGGELVARSAPRLATIGGYRMPGVAAPSQLIGFDMAGISVSAGSACSSGTLKPSHVLGAMGWSAQAAGEVVRVSFGPRTNEHEIDCFISAWRTIRERAKAA